MDEGLGSREPGRSWESWRGEEKNAKRATTQTRGRVYLDGVVTLVDAYYVLSYLGKAEPGLSVPRVEGLLTEILRLTRVQTALAWKQRP